MTLVYKCDGCGKIIGKDEALYSIEIAELVPDVGSWRKHQRSCALHLCPGCYGMFRAYSSVRFELEPAWPGESDQLEEDR